MQDPERPYSPDNPFAQKQRSYSPDNPFADTRARPAPAVGPPTSPSSWGQALRDMKFGPTGVGALANPVVQGIRETAQVTGPRLAGGALQALYESDLGAGNPAYQDDNLRGRISRAVTEPLRAGAEALTGYAERSAERLAPTRAAVEQQPGGKLMTDVVGGAGTMLPILGAAALGGPAGALAAGYGMGVGDVYTSATEKGRDPRSAGNRALALGVPYAALESLVPAGIANRVATKAGAPLVQRAVRGALTEAPTEFLQSILAQSQGAGGLGDINLGEAGYEAGIGALVGGGADIAFSPSPTEELAHEKLSELEATGVDVQDAIRRAARGEDVDLEAEAEAIRARPYGPQPQEVPQDRTSTPEAQRTPEPEVRDPLRDDVAVNVPYSPDNPFAPGGDLEGEYEPAGAPVGTATAPPPMEFGPVPTEEAAPEEELPFELSNVDVRDAEGVAQERQTYEKLSDTQLKNRYQKILVSAARLEGEAEDSFAWRAQSSWNNWGEKGAGLKDKGAWTTGRGTQMRRRRIALEELLRERGYDPDEVAQGAFAGATASRVVPENEEFVGGALEAYDDDALQGLVDETLAAMEQTDAGPNDRVLGERMAILWDELQRRGREDMVREKGPKYEALIREIGPLYHGSPHKFDRFDVSKLGSGEGAQAYGRGLYFTETEGVARSYRERLADRGTPMVSRYVGGLTADDLTRDAPVLLPPRARASDLSNEYAYELKQAVMGWTNRLRDKFEELRMDGYTDDEIMRELDGTVLSAAVNVRKDYDERLARAADPEAAAQEPAAITREVWLNALDFVRASMELSDFRGEPGGGLYTVTLRADDDEFLLYDKPVPEQPKTVLEALGIDDAVEAFREADAKMEELRQKSLARGDQGWDSMTEDEQAEYTDALFKAGEMTAAINKALGITGTHEDWTQWTGQRVLRSLKEEALHERGVKGVKYLDGMSRRKGEGSYNYVTFGDDIIDINEVRERGPGYDPGDRRESVQAFVSELEEKYPALQKIELYPSHGNTVELSMIQVDPDQRKAGIGSQVMEDITAWADENGQTVWLQLAEPSDEMGTTSTARLKKFYRRFGFIENKGRNKDFELSMYAQMYRRPEGGTTVREPTPTYELDGPEEYPGMDRPEIPGEQFTGMEGRWYSRVRRAIEQAPQESATGAQWIGMIRKAPEGVANTELEYGIESWLEQRADETLTRDEVLGAMDTQEIGLQESRYGFGSEVDRDRLQELDERWSRVRTSLDKAEDALEAIGLRVDHGIGGDRVGIVDTNQEYAGRTRRIGTIGSDGYLTESKNATPEQSRAMQAYALDRASLDYLAGERDKIRLGKRPKFERYTVPGPKEDYGEIVIRLDEKPGPRAEADAILNQIEREAVDPDGIRDPEAYRDHPLWTRYYDILDAQRGAEAEDPFMTDHWPDRNPLGHLRFSIREVNGERTFFIEEIQSDWHQKGRKKGYQGQVSEEALREAQEKHWSAQETLRRALAAVGAAETPAERAHLEAIAQEAGAQAENALAEMDRLRESAPYDAVPDAPLKSTSDWAGLFVRRALQEAVARGADRVAFTSGEQAHHVGGQAHARDLVDGVSWHPETKMLWAYSVRDDQWRKLGPVEKDALPEAIGSKVAAALLAQGPVANPGRDAYREGALMLEGDAFRVPLLKSGPSKFYDDVLPKIVTKELRKLGVDVGRLEAVALNTGERPSSDWAVFDPVSGDEYGRFPTEEEARARSGEIRGSDYSQTERPHDLGPTNLSFPITDELRKAVQGGLRVAEDRGTYDLFGQGQDTPLFSQPQEEVGPELDGPDPTEGMDPRDRTTPVIPKGYDPDVLYQLPPQGQSPTSSKSNESRDALWIGMRTREAEGRSQNPMEPPYNLEGAAEKILHAEDTYRSAQRHIARADDDMAPDILEHHHKRAAQSKKDASQWRTRVGLDPFTGSNYSDPRTIIEEIQGNLWQRRFGQQYSRYGKPPELEQGSGVGDERTRGYRLDALRVWEEQLQAETAQQDAFSDPGERSQYDKKVREARKMVDTLRADLGLPPFDGSNWIGSDVTAASLAPEPAPEPVPTPKDGWEGKIVVGQDRGGDPVEGVVRSARKHRGRDQYTLVVDTGSTDWTRIDSRTVTRVEVQEGLEGMPEPELAPEPEAKPEPFTVPAGTLRVAGRAGAEIDGAMLDMLATVPGMAPPAGALADARYSHPATVVWTAPDGTEVTANRVRQDDPSRVAYSVVLYRMDGQTYYGSDMDAEGLAQAIQAVLDANLEAGNRAAVQATPRAQPEQGGLFEQSQSAPEQSESAPELDGPTVLMGHTRGEKNVQRLQEQGWGRVMIDARPDPYPGEPWALDSGIFAEVSNARVVAPREDSEFWKGWVARLDRAREADTAPFMVVLPDAPVLGPDAGHTGLDSLNMSLEWLDALERNGYGDMPYYLAVQDGVTPERLDAIPGLASRIDGIFLGGSNEYKASQAEALAEWAHENGIKFHYGRAGTPKKLRHAYRIGADSVDSAFPLWSQERWSAFEEIAADLGAQGELEILVRPETARDEEFEEAEFEAGRELTPQERVAWASLDQEESETGAPEMALDGPEGGPVEGSREWWAAQPGPNNELDDENDANGEWRYLHPYGETKFRDPSGLNNWKYPSRTDPRAHHGIERIRWSQMETPGGIFFIRHEAGDGRWDVYHPDNDPGWEKRGKPNATLPFDEIQGYIDAVLAGEKYVEGSAPVPEPDQSFELELSGPSQAGPTDLFGNVVEPTVEQGSLLGGGLQGQTDALSDARATISQLTGKVARGTATKEEQARFEQARSFIRRQEGRGLDEGEINARRQEPGDEPDGDTLDLFTVREQLNLWGLPISPSDGGGMVDDSRVPVVQLEGPTDGSYFGDGTKVWRWDSPRGGIYRVFYDPKHDSYHAQDARGEMDGGFESLERATEWLQNSVESRRQERIAAADLRAEMQGGTPMEGEPTGSEAEVAFGSEEEADAAVEALDAWVDSAGFDYSADNRAANMRTPTNVSLVGQKLSSVEDAVRGMQGIRNPGWEVFSALLKKNGEVVAHFNSTMGRLGVGGFTPEMVNEILTQAVLVGADTAILVHNHPSGDPTPSNDADLPVTRNLNRKFRAIGVALEGHIVLNHDQFYWIPPDGSYAKVRRYQMPGVSESPWMSPMAITGRQKINQPHHVAQEAAKFSPMQDTEAAIFWVDTQFRVIAIERAGNMRPEWINQRRHQLGASRFFLVLGPKANADAWQDRIKMVQYGAAHVQDQIMDAVQIGADGTTFEQLYVPRNVWRPGDPEGTPEWGVDLPADARGWRGDAGASPGRVRESTDGYDSEGAGLSGPEGMDGDLERGSGLLDASGADPTGGSRGGQEPPGLDGPDGPAIPGLPPERRDAIEAALRGARGATTPSIIARGLEGVKHIADSFQHTWKYVRDPELGETLRYMRAASALGDTKAIQDIHDVVQGIKDNPEHMEAFEWSLVLPDLLRGIEEGEYDGGKALPFEFETKEEVQAKHREVQKLVEENPLIREALENRERLNDRVKRALVRADLLPESVLEDDRYYHRQVLAYLEAIDYRPTDASGGDARLRTMGFQRERVGSSKDWNTAYHEAEFEWLRQAYTLLRQKELLEELKRQSNILNEMKRQAKSLNLTNLGNKLHEQQPTMQMDQPMSAPYELVDQFLKPFRSKIAMSNSQLGKLAAENKLNGGGQFDDVVFGLQMTYEGWSEEAAIAKDDGADPPPFIFDDPRWFEFLAWLAEDGSRVGSLQARTIFKAIREREGAIKSALGDDYIEWHTGTRKGLNALQKIAPEGYRLWQPQQGNHFFQAMTISEQVVEALLAGEAEFTQDQLREATVMGGPRETWLIPEELARELDQWVNTNDPSPLDKFLAKSQGLWKQYILTGPTRIGLYNLNNMFGDLDAAFAGNQHILGYARKALPDLMRHARGQGDAELRAEIEDGVARGVIDSGFSGFEVPDIGEHHLFRVLASNNRNVIERGIRAYFGRARNFTTLRENWLRLAAWRYYKEVFQRNPDAKVYGASKRSEIDAMSDPDEKAAKISRELIGDYGAISVAGQWIRRTAIPFWSWMEINFPRYYRLATNAPKDETVSTAGRLARMSAYYVILALGAHLLYPDDDDLDEDEQRAEREAFRRGRGELHLPLPWRTEDNTVRSIRVPGAASDALEWMGLEDFPSDIADVSAGRQAWYDPILNAPKAATNRMLQGIRPDVKAGIEVLTGRTWYPSMWLNERGTDWRMSGGRPVRDRVAQMLSPLPPADDIYNTLLRDRPSREDSPADVAAGLLSYQTDPKEQAYWEVRDLVRRFREKIGEGGGPSVQQRDPEAKRRSNALYYYKRALTYGQDERAQRWLQEYTENGGTMEGLQRSASQMDPLYGLDRDQQAAFMAQLAEQDRALVGLARQHYSHIFAR